MNKQLLLDEVAKLLEINVENLADGFELKKCMNWDSLAVVSIIGLLDVHFNISVEIEQIERCQTIRDLFDVFSSNTSVAV